MCFRRTLCVPAEMTGLVPVTMGDDPLPCPHGPVPGRAYQRGDTSGRTRAAAGPDMQTVRRCAGSAVLALMTAVSVQAADQPARVLPVPDAVSPEPQACIDAGPDSW